MAVKKKEDEMRFESAIALLRSVQCEAIGHSRGALLDHLIGTYELLKEWGAAESVCLAGLFHSVYGTETFRGGKDALLPRNIVRSAIGAEAERLAWLFGMKTNRSFWKAVRGLSNGGPQEGGPHALEHRVTGERILSSREELVSLISMVMANAIEQGARYALPDQSNPLGLERLLPYCLPKAASTYSAIWKGETA